MIVSILQLMGFPMGKPVHSRAGETPLDSPSKARIKASSPSEHLQASSARRQEVIAKSGKDNKAKAAPAKKAAAKPVSKAPAKPAPKTDPSAKPVAKSGA